MQHKHTHTHTLEHVRQHKLYIFIYFENLKRFNKIIKLLYIKPKSVYTLITFSI